MSCSRYAVSVAVALGLAGCSAPPVSNADAPGYGMVTARIVAPRNDQVIEVHALDRLAITAVSLVAPDGSRTEAYSIDTAANPSSSTTEFGAPNETSTLIGQIASAALIRISQPADYAQNWKRTRIEVRFGLGDDASVQNLAAPPPV